MKVPSQGARQDSETARSAKYAVAEGYRQVAPGWARWRREFKIAGAGLTEALLAAAGVQPGMRVLDVACGVGEPALAIAPLVGPSGKVIAVDIVPEMLLAAAAEATARLSFCVADGEALPFRTGTFDVVTCRAAIMHFPDPVSAAAEAHRVLRQGGRYVVTALGPEAETPAVAATISVLSRHGGRQRTLPTMPDPYRFGEPGALTSLLTSADFCHVHEQIFTTHVKWPGTAAHFLRALPEHGWLVADLLETLPADVSYRARLESLAMLQSYEDDGVMNLPVPVAIASAVRQRSTSGNIP